MSSYRGTKEIAATIRQELKKQLPAWKFSVTMDSYSGGSSITVALMSGPERVVEARREYVFGRDHVRLPYTAEYPFPGYAQLNHYQLLNNDGFEQAKRLSNGEYLTETGWEVMRKAAQILSFEHWDKSDSMTDYFCTNFYRHVHIGKWNKDYEVTA